MKIESNFEELLFKAREFEVDDKLAIKSKYRRETGIFRISIAADSQQYTCTVKRASELKHLGKLNSSLFMALAGTGNE
jgi:hypothetical protein